MQIKNSVFLVTGGASGLGAASARMAAENGGKVVIADLQPAGEQLARELNGRFIKTDVTSEADGKAAVALALKEFGGLHVLVNCAGIALAERTLGKETPHDLARFQKVLNVNVIGTFACIQAVVPIMKVQKRGAIINIGSNAVHKGLPHLLHYVASKGAVHAVTRALARELGPFGITVNAVAPGYVLHDGTAAFDEGRNEQVVALRALCRTETPADVVGTVAFLASEDSCFVTGQTIVVDGGEVFA